MTRKQYERRVQELILAIYRHPSSNFPEGYKVGNSLRYFKRRSKGVPKDFGSYEEAWNCKEMRWAREFYGVG